MTIKIALIIFLGFFIGSANALVLVEDDAQILGGDAMVKLNGKLNDIYKEHSAIIVVKTWRSEKADLVLGEKMFRTRELDTKGEPMFNMLILYDISTGDNPDTITVAHSNRCVISKADVLTLFSETGIIDPDAVDKALSEKAKKVNAARFLNFVNGIESLIEAKIKEGLSCPIVREDAEPGCKTLISKGPANKKLDVTLVGDDYTSLSEFEKDARKAIGGIMKQSVFQRNADKINFYIATDIAAREVSTCNINNPDLCTLGLYDYAKEKASLCPSDKIILITKRYRTFLAEPSRGIAIVSSSERSIQSGETLDKTAPHEFAHFFGVVDEYIKPNGPDEPVQPNCAPDITTAEKWWGDLVREGAGYYSGCHFTPDNIRPTENSIMRDFLTGTGLGPVNSRHIQKFFERYA